MDISRLLREPQAAAEVEALARAFNIDRGQAEAVVASVAPQLAQRLERQTLSRGGLADLVSTLGVASAGGPPIGSPEGTTHGNALLEQVLGTKDVSRAVAARAAAGSGIGATIIQAMLPYIIQMLLGGLARRASGGLGDILSKLPQPGGRGGMPGPAPGPAPRPMSFPTGPASSPLPGPEGMQLPGGSGGGGNPYGDLSDIIRRGGGGVNVGGGSLWGIVRSILGGILGFQSRGIVGWIVRLVVMRWGWQILSRVLGRLFVRR